MFAAHFTVKWLTGLFSVWVYQGSELHRYSSLILTSAVFSYCAVVKKKFSSKKLQKSLTSQQQWFIYSQFVALEFLIITDYCNIVHVSMCYFYTLLMVCRKQLSYLLVHEFFPPNFSRIVWNEIRDYKDKNLDILIRHPEFCLFLLFHEAKTTTSPWKSGSFNWITRLSLKSENGGPA